MALVAFDLNGTLLDPGERSEQLQAAVRLAMAHTLADDARPFAELLEAAGGSVPDEMSPFEDVPRGLERLAEAGHRLVVLTNSARETAVRQLGLAGLLERFERVIGVDEVGAYKPDLRVYRYAIDQLAADAGDTWLVAAHDWDVIGAHGAGWRTAFVDRGGPSPVTVTPDRTVDRIDALEL